MSQHLTTICHSFLGSMLISFLTFIGLYAVILLVPTFLGIVISVVVFVTGFAFVFSEINLSPRNSTWRSVIGVVMAVSPIVVGFLNVVLTPEAYIAY